jgi:transposase-like protein
MIRFTAADRAKAIRERSLEDFAKRSYKPSDETLTRSAVNAFAIWLAASGLSLRQAGERLGVSRETVRAWRQKGAPAYVMDKLKA